MGGYERIDFTKAAETLLISDLCRRLGWTQVKNHSSRRHLVLQDPKDGEEIIIFKDKSGSERYFVRGIQKTDNVISFIRERLNKFNVSGKTEWEQVANVVRQHLTTPPTEQTFEIRKDKSQFNLEMYRLKPLYDFNYLFNRGLKHEYLALFKPYIFNNSYKGRVYTVFPFYANKREITGLDVRYAESGENKKYIAPGSDMQYASWNAQYVNQGTYTTYVLTESPIDALSYLQINYPIKTIKENGVKIESINGSVREGVMSIIKRETLNRKLIIAMDNDIGGVQHTLKILYYLNKNFTLSPFNIKKEDEHHSYVDEKTGDYFNFENTIEAYRQFLDEMIQHYEVDKSIEIHFPTFKDWNEELQAQISL